LVKVKGPNIIFLQETLEIRDKISKGGWCFIASDVCGHSVAILGWDTRNVSISNFWSVNSGLGIEKKIGIGGIPPLY